MLTETPAPQFNAVTIYTYRPLFLGFPFSFSFLFSLFSLPPSSISSLVSFAFDYILIPMISATSPLATAVSALATAKSNLTPIPPRGYRNLGFRLSSQRFGPSEMDLVRKVTRGCFGDSAGKGRMVEVESVGGEDVFDAVVAAEAKVFPEHLVIMVNGIVGSAADWKYAAEQFVKKLPDKVIVHRSECNYSTLTFNGVDLMGERLADEVLAVVKRWPEVRKISFVAHSLGGLVARYAVARLYESFPKMESSGLSVNHSVQSLEQPYEDRIAGLEPMNFITFATPHLGSRGHKQLPLLCGLPFLEKRASQTAHWIAGRSGKHLFLTDSDDGRPPLLLQMVNDSDDLKFISALRSFKRRVAYANANYDHVVGWSTSSIRRQDELPKINHLVKDEKYPHIVYIERETTDDFHNKASSIAGDQTTDIEEEMIQGLTQVPWERVDVSFHKSRQRYVAHNTIQVKSYWLNSDGADVVFHMIDNFLL